LSRLNKQFLDNTCRIIHKRIVDGWTTLPLSLYPYEEDYVEYYVSIFEFIRDGLFFNDMDVVNEIFMYFIYNYNEDGDYDNNKIPNITKSDILDMFDDTLIVLSDFFNVTPFLLERMVYDHYSMPVYYVYNMDTHFSIGNHNQLQKAIEIYIDSEYMEPDDVLYRRGNSVYLECSYVNDTNKRLLSIDESNNAEANMGDEDIIEYLDELMEENEDAIRIVKEYEEVSETWGELPFGEYGDELREKMDELVYEGRELVKELVYDDTYEKLSNNDTLIEYMWELGYVKRKDGIFYLEGKSPKWLSFDWDKFIEYEMDDFDITQLSDTSDVDEFNYNGHIYYIIQVDY
jgi:hypothetical protein